MFPNFSIYNFVNKRTTNRKFLGDCKSITSFEIAPNPKHLFLSKLRFAFAFSVSVLFNRVGFVVRISSQPKMIRPYARRVVAGVANLKTFRDGFIVKGIRISMSLDVLVKKGKNPIAILIGLASPNPAILCTFDLLKESLRGFFDSVQRSAFHASEPLIAPGRGFTVQTKRTFFIRILSHLKVSPLDVMPLDVKASQGFYFVGA